MALFATAVQLTLVSKMLFDYLKRDARMYLNMDPDGETNPNLEAQEGQNNQAICYQSMVMKLLIQEHS